MKEPKDFHLARRAYEAFYEEQPQIWFNELSHDYQMRWVRVARAIMEDEREYKKFTPKAPNGGRPSSRMTEEKARQLIADAPKKSGGTSTRVDHRAMSKRDSDMVKRAYGVLKQAREAKKSH